MQTKKDVIKTLTGIYDWHTKLFINSIDGIDKKDVHNRLGTKANHVGWIAGSIVNERYALASFFNVRMKTASPDLFKDHQGIVENAIYPSLEEYRSDWEKINPVLREALINVTDEELAKPDPWEMPGGPYTFVDTIIACMDRESYCIGQIGLWRRLLGYPAMKYE